MKITDKIVTSKIAPKQLNVVWHNPETGELKMFNDGWKIVGGSSVDTTNVEQVVFNINNSDGSLDLSTVVVNVTDNTDKKTETVRIDSVGMGIINIPLGHSYTIELGKIDHYVTSNALYSYTFTAEQYVRPINIIYRHSYSNFDNIAKYFILEKELPNVVTGGSDSVLDRILEGDALPGSYVIDEVHKKYAKLNPLNHMEFADGTAYTGLYGNCFRHFPTIYILKDPAYEGKGTKYWISDMDFTNDSNVSTYVLPESWIGIYKADVIDNKLTSRPGTISKGNITINNFQGYALNLGPNYGINDYKNWQKLCALFVAKYSTTNVDATDAGTGLAESSNSNYYNISTGITSNIGDATGKVQYLSTGYYQCKLFGIEAPWGQQCEFLKGIYFKGSTAYVYNSNTYTTDEAPERTFTRMTSGTQSFISKLLLGDYFDVMPTEVQGSSATGYCDAMWTANGENLLCVGGYSSDGLSSGLFSSNAGVAFSASIAILGARLCFYGNINEYTLVSGAELADLNE